MLKKKTSNSDQIVNGVTNAVMVLLESLLLRHHIMASSEQVAVSFDGLLCWLLQCAPFCVSGISVQG